MPKIDNNISSVPLNYFTDGVQAAKGPEQEQKQSSWNRAGRNERNSRGMVRQNSASRLMMQLDILMTKAAVASTKSLDGKAVKDSLQELVDGDILEKDSLKQLEKTADKAAKALKALDKFTGAQLANAVKQIPGRQGAAGCAVIDEKSKVGKAMSAAVMAQNDLADMLAQLYKGLDAYDRRARQNQDSNAQEIDPDILGIISEMRMMCDRRATEINALAYQMHDFAMYRAARGHEADPHITTILQAKVKELLPRQALAMHGTVDLLGGVSEEVIDKLKPLADRIEAVRNNPSGLVDAKSILSLQTEIRSMRDAMASCRINGVSVGWGDKVLVAKDIVRGLEAELEKLDEQFKVARRTIAKNVRKGIVANANQLLRMNRKDEQQLEKANEDVAHLFKLRRKFLDELDEYVAYADESGSQDDRSLNALKDLKRSASDLAEYAKKYKEPDVSSGMRRDFERISGACKQCGTIASQLELVGRFLSDEVAPLSGDEVMSIFNGELSISTMVELRARNMKAEDFDPNTDESKIVSSRLLGRGGAGEAYELTGADGSKFVFKGEMKSRTGLGNMCVGSTGEYSHSQMVVNLNIAAKKTANALGCGELLVNYSAGTHKGVFGFFMDKARGLSPASIERSPSKAPEGGLSAKEINKLPAEEKQRIIADMKRQLNRLQWLDIVTGQEDRHCDNYFIHVDRETHKVTVKGIDNDAGFSKYRVGVSKYELDKEKADSFRLKMHALAREIDPNNSKNEYQNLRNDPGLTFKENDIVAVDTSKIQNPALISLLPWGLGSQFITVPDKIDRDMYNSLMELKNNQEKRQELFAQLEDRLSKDNLEATKRRLDDAIALAERLGKEGKVIEKDDWMNQEERPRPKVTLEIHTIRGNLKKLTPARSNFYNLITSPTYYTRDLADKIF